MDGQVMESNGCSTHVQGSFWCLSENLLLRSRQRHGAGLHDGPGHCLLCFALLFVLVVQYTIVMPYVDGRVAHAMDERRPGM